MREYKLTTEKTNKVWNNISLFPNFFDEFYIGTSIFYNY